jgi:hypothetical protein
MASRLLSIEQTSTWLPRGSQPPRQVEVGSADDADVGAPGDARAQPLVLAIPQDAQALDLAGQRQVAELVEE